VLLLLLVLLFTWCSFSPWYSNNLIH